MASSIDLDEVAKFARHASEWWAPDGPLHTLHDINPARLGYIESHVTLKGQRVLDIGCGGGILAESMARHGAIVTGLDVEPDAIAAAQQHAAAEQVQMTYVCQPVEYFVAEPFPIITCMEMLEHVPEPQFILEQAARLLAPGGYLFLSTINRTFQAYASVVFAAEYVLDLLPRQTHDYQRFIKPSELAAIVRSLDLEVIGLTGLAYHPWSRTASLVASVSENYVLVCRSCI
ncbi:MAG: bifunctional 3-demethylubiquinol 3-O-methyltransferase/2-polyprenyl-6-hydroxyphenol methylase [Legionella sp.]|nr:MAG: bifunctional 3-demethylubiquinol 3-O-methyltransferase/2-polyprenyl-6-hydroxyphenol methylase [Legionella sp.]